MGLMVLDRGEFEAAMSRVYAGLDQINARLDVLNGRTRKCEERLTRLETWGSALAVGVAGVWAVVQWVTR